MSLEKLKEQIEFYFSDSNYSRDKFMQEKASMHDGYIPISTLLTFQRLRAMGPTIEEIKEAMRDSTVVEMEGDALRKVKTEAFAEYLNDKEVSKRTVYMKGFDVESTLDDIKEVLREHCKPVRITQRRTADRKFKGSCFVEFGSKAEAEAAQELKIEVKTGGEEGKRQKGYIAIEGKDEYLAKGRKGEKKEAEFSAKVKASFVPKLYRFEAQTTPSVEEIKKAVAGSGFVDLQRKAIRMKFAEDWSEKEFSVGGGEKIKLVKMGEEEAREYLKCIVIKKRK